MLFCVLVVLRICHWACVLKLAAAVALLLRQVEEVNLFRERRTHVSKGCGFVTMHSRDQAIAVSRQALHITAIRHCLGHAPCSCWLRPQCLCFGVCWQPSAS